MVCLLSRYVFMQIHMPSPIIMPFLSILFLFILFLNPLFSGKGQNSKDGKESRKAAPQAYSGTSRTPPTRTSQEAFELCPFPPVLNPDLHHDVPPAAALYACIEAACALEAHLVWVHPGVEELVGRKDKA